jgi:hypothetical protein
MILKRIPAGALVAAVIAMGAFFTWARADAAPGSDSEMKSEIAALRRATGKFHGLENTLASGRSDLHLCVNQMGQHYANSNTFGDGVLDPVNPEAMVYADDGRGQLQLVAVEWVSTTPGQVLGIPLHFNPSVDLWILHAWIWRQNPNGMFTDMNPDVGNCP